MSLLPSHVSFPQDRLPERCCPACGADNLRTFYRVQGIPVQSNLLVDNAKEAAHFPTGDVLLALCETCAFITNVAFDESRLMMSQAYEASQACSATFGSFAKSLAQKWIEKYKLNGKTIIEIGCGQGEFLELICELAGARGIGFDPVVRREQSDRANAMFVAGNFEHFAKDVKADFIFCRHTLEHIAEPLNFLTAVREPLVDTPVAFEVPDTARVLTEGAFWDIYYEHNSYFTRESLVRVFQRAGFDVHHTSLEFDGQYLVLEAEPTGGQRRDMPTLSELRLASQFVRVCTTRMQEWTTFADDAKRTGKRCVVWGSGSKAVGFLTSAGIADAFECVVDINPAKQGSYLPGTSLQIVGPNALKTVRPDVVVVMNPIYRNEIERDLNAMGLTPNVIAL
ncbi:MAG: class I SAM-dependent methyltransferase [Tepidisphaeraceae bacterium]